MGDQPKYANLKAWFPPKLPSGTPIGEVPTGRVLEDKTFEMRPVTEDEILAWVGDAIRRRAERN